MDESEDEYKINNSIIDYFHSRIGSYYTMMVFKVILRNGEINFMSISSKLGSLNKDREVTIAIGFLLEHKYITLRKERMGRINYRYYSPGERSKEYEDLILGIIEFTKKSKEYKAEYDLEQQAKNNS